MGLLYNYLPTLSFLSLLSLLSLFASVKLVRSDEENEILTDCLGVSDDDYHFFQLLENYPVVKAKCSNGFIVVDYSVDNDWKDYFSSWFQWHRNIVGAEKNDLVDWQKWFVPDSGSNAYKYMTALDCNSCDGNDVLTTGAFEVDLEHGSYAYYMNASSFGCISREIGLHSCDMSYDGSNECHACSSIKWGKTFVTEWEGGANSDLIHGNCYVMTLPDSWETYTDFDSCADPGFSGNVNPSLGMAGDHCVCVRPGEDAMFQQRQRVAAIEVAGVEDLVLKKKQSLKEKRLSAEEEQTAADMKTSENNLVYLTQEDFLFGTYRITESGTYVVTEDIVFDFNAPSNYDDIKYEPNDEGLWWPTEDQVDEYPGAGQFFGPYQLGFFAGITIETNDVVLDLNGKELKMSKEYYYQQPFWSTIELSSQVFLPGQGITFFGPDPKSAKNVEVKNGKLGLSSHHCIHGIEIEDVILRDLECYDFTTHGIQINGFKNLAMYNVDVGNNAEINFLNPDYSNMRSLLPRFRAAALDYGEGEIQFKNKVDPIAASKVWTFNELLALLELQLHYAYKYVLHEGDLSILAQIFDFEDAAALERDSHFQDSLKLFVNFDEERNLYGMPFGGVMYGMILKNSGSAIPSYFPDSDAESTQNLVLENVRIHDLTHDTFEEVFWVPFDRRVLANPLNVNVRNLHVWEEAWIQTIPELAPSSWHTWNPKYKGSVMSDLLFALGRLTHDDPNYISVKGFSNVKNEILSWAIDGTDFYSSYTDDRKLRPFFQCNSDTMIHINKGTYGMRLSGVYNVKMKDVTIRNIRELGAIGSEMCGEYTTSHLRSMYPYVVGYTGNRAQGLSTEFSRFRQMENVQIDSIISDTGPAYGIQFYPGTVLRLKQTDSVNIENIVAGNDEQGIQNHMQNSAFGLQRDSLPNALPRACGVKVTEMIKGQGAPFSIGVSVRSDEEENVDLEQIFKNHCVSNVFTSCAMSDDDDEVSEAITELGGVGLSDKCEYDTMASSYAVNKGVTWRSKVKVKDEVIGELAEHVVTKNWISLVAMLCVVGVVLIAAACGGMYACTKSEMLNAKMGVFVSDETKGASLLKRADAPKQYGTV